MGYHVLLQGILLTQWSNPRLLRLLHGQAGSLPLAPPGKSPGRGAPVQRLMPHFLDIGLKKLLSVLQTIECLFLFCWKFSCFYCPSLLCLGKITNTVSSLCDAILSSSRHGIKHIMESYVAAGRPPGFLLYSSPLDHRASRRTGNGDAVVVLNHRTQWASNALQFLFPCN